MSAEVLALSVIMPAFRQEKTIRRDVESVLATLSTLHSSFELVVVVDGQVDRTEAEARLVSDGRLRLVGYPGPNRGKGYALRFGTAQSRGARVVFLDAGMDIDPAGISMLLAHMDWYDADVIVASKRHPVSKVDYPAPRRILSLGYQLLARLLFGLTIRDTQTGLKAFRREVLEKVMPRLLVKDYAIDIELLAVAHRLGFRRIFEAPVNVNHPFFSLAQKSIVRTIARMLRDTLAVFYRLKIRRYYDDGNERKWVYDPQLKMRINVG